MEIRDRLTTFVQGLPVAHRVGIGVAGVALLMLVVMFARWVTTPSYTVLYAGLAETEVATAVDQLESAGVPYRLEAGGSTIMVPRDQLYLTRANLAGSGVVGRSSPQGYELLDDQGLSISDFRQRVDYRRAIEGELAKTLSAMDGIDAARVQIVIPEQQVFTEQQQPATASVLLTTVRRLSASEVDAVTFLVSSSVEGLEPSQITVADSSGAVLHAPGDAAGNSQLASRQLRQTREFEQALAADITTLLTQASSGSPASVVVRASLNFDESETQTETYDDESTVALREQTSREQYEGTNAAAPGGAVGVDGGPIDGTAGEGTYERDEATREFGVDRVTTRTVTAPGKVEKLSVAIVMDDGTSTGAAVPEPAEVQRLVTAALGLDEERGDEIAVTTVAMPAQEDIEEPAGPGLMDDLPQYGGILVLLLVAGGLFLMTRQRVTVQSIERLTPAERRQPEPEPELTIDEEAWQLAEQPPDPIQDEVTQLVQSQPEEIAALLRGWLADRRS